MAKKNLATATSVENMLRTNSIIIEVGGSIRRITLDNLMNAINEGNEELLRSVAWCVPIKHTSQSSPAWGRSGNLDMWEEYKQHSGRYLYKNNGKHAKLSKTYSGIYADGTTLDESIGHVMCKFPDLYYRVVQDATTGIYNLWMSQLPIGGHVIKSPVIGAYKGSISNSALVSRSGAAPAGSKTIQAFWNAAQVNGADWGLANYEHRKFMIMLQLSEYGNANIQASLGNGLTGTNNSSDWQTALTFPCGNTKTLGDDFGSVSHNYTMSNGTQTVGACDVSLLGIENPYGQQWEMVQGVYCGKSANEQQTGKEVFLYEGNRMPTDAELASHPIGDYRQLERPASNGYVSQIILGEHFDIFPKALGGGSTSYWCDYFYQDQAGGQLVLVGGAASHGSYCGLACVASSHGWADSYANIGSRLAFYGVGQEVSGKELVAGA